MGLFDRLNAKMQQALKDELTPRFRKDNYGLDREKWMEGATKDNQRATSVSFYKELARRKQRHKYETFQEFTLPERIADNPKILDPGLLYKGAPERPYGPFSDEEHRSWLERNKPLAYGIGGAGILAAILAAAYAMKKRKQRG